MSISNQSARRMIDALELLRQVEAVDLTLEKTSLQHKITALLQKERTDDMRGKSLIDDMSDEELAWAIAQMDERIGLHVGSFIDPFIFNYLRRYRPGPLRLGDDIRLGRLNR